MKNHWLIIYLFIVCHFCGLICGEEDDELSLSTLDHPDKNGYHSVVSGTDKHNYGYQLKASGKHFHHTSTEKDGVRLGCYGYELDGKKYITQYVADARGYRLVTNQDLISVYPKSGTAEGKAGFFGGDFGDDDESHKNVRYFFPKGCKGIDVQIDNSSRLRSLKIFDVNPRLPVTLKPNFPNNAYYYTRPPASFPGPPNIYAPNMIPIQTARPPTAYLPPNEKPTNTYLPPEKPNNTYLPPDNTYLPPENPENPDNTYLPPDEPDNTYLPPDEPNNSYIPPELPSEELPENSIDNAYLPPENPTNIYLPPPSLNNTYLPPQESSSSSSSSSQLITELLPPKEENCPSVSCCDDSSLGKFIIPIQLKNRNSKNCCANTAKLILPIKYFDEAMVEKIKATIPQELNADELIQNIIKNLL